MKRLLLFGVLEAAILAGGCGEKKSETVAAAPSAPAPISLPASAKTEEFLTVSGPLIVEHQVDLTAQRDGRNASQNGHGSCTA